MLKVANRFFTIVGYTLSYGRNIFYTGSCTWPTRRRGILASCCLFKFFDYSANCGF
uniref:Uncharacterized protein n=1 Tax=Lepeophtheirus salmonis TaxID=72036 RepID=A0A0K2URW9_LEPSM